MRSVAVFVKGPGAGRESALRALQAVGFKVTPHPRRHPGAAQRLPARPSDAASECVLGRAEKRENDGSLSWSRLQALSPRGDEALPEGRALLHREVLVHPPAVSAGPARPGAHQAERVRDPSAREAEGAGASTASSSGSSRSTTSTPRAGRGGRASRCSGLLESRLDSVVHRLGFAFTRSQARQVVRHGHILVNGKRLDIPSVILRPGDKIEIRQKSREVKEINASLAQVDKRPILSWLELDKANFAGTFKGLPGPRGAERAGDSRAVRRRVLLEMSHETSSRHGQVAGAAGERVRRRAGTIA